MKDAGSIVSMDAALSVEDQTRGLDWVHWLLRSVRQRCAGVVMAAPARKTEAHAAWRAFVQDTFLPTLAPALLRSWELSQARDAEALLQHELAWHVLLDEPARERSLRAGALLLKRTQGARFQGVLGLYRTAVDEGRAEGHIGVVWPALASLFQLTPATMLAEYLRLEWETATRELPGLAVPIGSTSIAKTVTRVLQSAPAEPRVLRRRKSAAR